MNSSKNRAVDGRFWLAAGGPAGIGHDRISLLEAIRETGSITGAAKAVGISYKAAWDAVATMNNLAERPLVETNTGGRRGGGTRLTDYGLELVSVYRTAEEEFEAFLHRLGEGISHFEQFYTLMRRLGMKTSARNQVAGEVRSVHRGAVNSEVILDTGGTDIVAVITNESADDLGLTPGQSAYALIKASWVLLTRADDTIKTSARNRLCGEVLAIRKGEVNAEVVLSLGGEKHLTAIITSESVDALGLEEGKPACALIKASHVILAVDA